MLSRRVAAVLPVGTLVAVVVVGGLGLAVHGQKALRLDQWADSRLIDTGARVHHLATVLHAIGNPAQFACLLIATVVIWVWCAGWGQALAVACGVGLDLILTEVVLKPVVGRVPPIRHGNTFPSGHTAAVVGVATVLAVLLVQPRVARHIPRWFRIVLGVALFAVATSVGLAMIVTRAHYLTDVIAAIPIGIMVPLLTLNLFDRLARRRKPATDSAAQRALPPRGPLPADPTARDAVQH